MKTLAVLCHENACLTCPGHHGNATQIGIIRIKVAKARRTGIIISVFYVANFANRNTIMTTFKAYFLHKVCYQNHWQFHAMKYVLLALAT